MVRCFREHETAYIAILGGPGMGKTTLAISTLYHASLKQKFSSRQYFIPCDAAEGQTDILKFISAALGLTSSGQAATQRALIL